MSRLNKRIVHEMSNNKYTVLEFFIADLIATAVLVTSFLPVLPIPYFMMGFPSKGFPFFILACWLVLLLLLLLSLFIIFIYFIDFIGFRSSD